MSTAMTHQKEAVKSGYLTLYHYDPRRGMDGESHPLKLDSREPTVPYEQFAMKEGRFSMLVRSDPDRAKQLMQLAQLEIQERWRLYEQMAGVERALPQADPRPGAPQPGTTPQPDAPQQGGAKDAGGVSMGGAAPAGAKDAATPGKNASDPTPPKQEVRS